MRLGWRVGTIGYVGLLAAMGLGGGFAACSSDSSGGATTGDGGSGSDGSMVRNDAGGGTDGGSGSDAGSGNDGSGGNDAGGGNDGAVVGDAAADGGAVTATPITLPGPAEPLAMAGNSTTNRLYIAMCHNNGEQLVVLDTTSDTVVTTIPAPSPGACLAMLAVDETSNRLYAAGGSFGNPITTIYAIDGSTNTVTATFPLPPTDAGAALEVKAIAVDGAAHRLYASTSSLAGGQPPEVTIIDTTSTLTVVGSVPMPDMQSADCLAMDPTNHALFAVGQLTATSATIPFHYGADHIDTTTNALSGTQQDFNTTNDNYYASFNFEGYRVQWCQGGPGYAFAINSQRDGVLATSTSTSTLFALEPAAITLPQGFVASAISTEPDPISSGNTIVNVLGFMAGTCQPASTRGHVRNEQVLSGFDSVVQSYSPSAMNDPELPFGALRGPNSNTYALEGPMADWATADAATPPPTILVKIPAM
jgi:hypothetical protein